MNKERFLDVNGFNSEYDIPLEKRLNKYRKRDEKSGPRTSPSISVTDKLRTQSEAWRSDVRRKQIIAAIAAAVIFALVVALSCYLTFWM